MNITIEDIRKAILRGDKAIGSGIELPSPQTIGTFMQRNTYALLKAREIHEQHFQGNNSSNHSSENDIDRIINNYDTP